MVEELLARDLFSLHERICPRLTMDAVSTIYPGYLRLIHLAARCFDSGTHVDETIKSVMHSQLMNFKP